MLKTIVVAVDGSDHAARAAELAIDLAQRYGAALFALSVYRHYSNLESSHSLVRTREVPESPDATLSVLAREAADWVVEKARERGFEQVEPVVRRGPAARTIIDFAREKGADAVVLGSRGLGDITGMLLGSVSHKVNSLAGCTCITVK